MPLDGPIKWWIFIPVFFSLAFPLSFLLYFLSFSPSTPSLPFLPSVIPPSILYCSNSFYTFSFSASSSFPYSFFLLIFFSLLPALHYSFQLSCPLCKWQVILPLAFTSVWWFKLFFWALGHLILPVSHKIALFFSLPACPYLWVSRLPSFWIICAGLLASSCPGADPGASGNLRIKKL